MTPPAPQLEKPSADRPVAWRGTLVLVLLGLGAQALQWVCAMAPGRTDDLYSQAIYPHVQRILAGGSSFLPFSIAETLLLGASAWIIWRLGRGLRAWRAGRRRLRNLSAHALAQAAGTFGVLFLAFQLLWGLNHARLPFAWHVGLELREVDTGRLVRVVEQLARRAAACRPAILDQVDPEQPLLARDWRDRIAEAYTAAGRELPVLAGPRAPLRTPWISKLMTLGSITGIYSPFTGEPHVNGDLPDVLQPFVACHETAHLRGFAREDEANFIAWWVGSRSADPLTAYSCELQAYRIALARLFAVDGMAAFEVRSRTPAPVAGDARRVREFWLGQPQVLHRTLTAVSRVANDAYLKSSGHADGVRSYGRMVDLLIAALGE